jgi:carboxypeptidase family protein
MAGVTIRLDNPTIAFTRTTITDAGGRYNFSDIPAADGYKIMALLNDEVIDSRDGIKVEVGEQYVVFPALRDKRPYLDGGVYDADGRPMPGVTVRLENPAIALIRTTTTTAAGAYVFTGLPPGNGYNITALQDGREIDRRDGIDLAMGDRSWVFPALKVHINGERPLSEVEIEEGLAKGITAVRMQTLVKEMGTNFQLTQDCEKRLLSAGATDALIVAIAGLDDKYEFDRKTLTFKKTK